MKKIGIVGGLSSESTIEYYKSINDLYYEKKMIYPEIIIYSMNLQKFVDLLNSNNINEILNEFIRICEILKQCGADFGLIASNTPHIIFDELITKTDLPLISILKKQRNMLKTMA